MQFLRKKSFLMFVSSFLFLSFSFITFNTHKVLATSLERYSEDLTENVYRIINIAYSFDLPDYITTLEDKDRYKEFKGIEENKFSHAFFL